MRSNRWESREGSPLPLGVTRIAAERAYNFALYSRDATRVWLLLYAPSDLAVPVVLRALDPLVNKSGRVWHCRVAEDELAGARYYAYCVDGPIGPMHRFDPDKILLDPYARGVCFPPGFDRDAAIGPGSNAGRAPLGVIDDGHAPPFDWGEDARPWHTSDLVIYELHVRGFTMRESSGVAAERRGTFLGVIDKIPYLLELGITAVELLPVHQFDPGEHNFWGYMTLSYFTVHAGYATAGGDATDELRQMIKALHAAGIEVIIDVVYGHTTELGDDGPTYSFRGIDNSTYYLMEGDRYRDDTGAGNVLRTSNPAVRTLVVDSLLYWATTMHVDGFRFDLASIFTRRDDGTIDPRDSAIISEISSEPALSCLRLIAEAWDITAYQLGRGFPGVQWHQWNGRFRDEVRSFVKGDRGRVPAVMARLYGSDDLFPNDGMHAYHAYQSVNFVTCHDGFTLYDLVAYDAKHNAANGHGNADGADQNWSWNCGWEGDLGAPPEVLALRKRQAKSFCCLLLLANGTPMFRAGDELLHTQHGNNNPYNQDNETSWLDWTRLETHRDVFEFWKKMIAFRKAHPSLGRSRHWRADVRWYGVGAAVDYADTSHAFAFFLAGAAEADADLYVMVNAYWEPLPFEIQEGPASAWRRAIDTAGEPLHEIAEPGAEPALASATCTVAPRSVAVLIRRGC